MLKHRRKHFRSTTKWTAGGDVLDPLEDNLMLYQAFEEASGNRLDLKNGYAFAPTNDNGRKAGVHGFEPDWDGSMYFTLAHATYDLLALAATEVFTISFWFQQTNENTDRFFFSVGTFPTYGVHCWYRRNGDSNARKLQVRSYQGGASANFVSTSNWDDDSLHHFCLTVNGDGVNGWNLYIDNSLEGQGTGGCGDDNSASSFGDSGLGSGVLTTTNSLDELSIWNTPLSGAAIAAIYNTGTGAFYTG